VDPPITEDIFALGSGHAAGHDVDSRYEIGKQSVNVGFRRGEMKFRKALKSFVLLVELTRIELVTS